MPPPSPPPCPPPPPSTPPSYPSLNYSNPNNKFLNHLNHSSPTSSPPSPEKLELHKPHKTIRHISVIQLLELENGKLEIYKFALDYRLELVKGEVVFHMVASDSSINTTSLIIQLMYKHIRASICIFGASLDLMTDTIHKYNKLLSTSVEALDLISSWLLCVEGERT
ncbi:hypothetical protein Tco_1344897 [Tanacetum coccineum]